MAPSVSPNLVFSRCCYPYKSHLTIADNGKIVILNISCDRQSSPNSNTATQSQREQREGDLRQFSRDRRTVEFFLNLPALDLNY
ncbi:MAG: hypothetical protein SW833_23915 [Cyanobacteriota bacterium]|nr:hypothetical protein [Cyanobacteriota bacterium]